MARSVGVLDTLDFNLGVESSFSFRNQPRALPQPSARESVTRARFEIALIRSCFLRIGKCRVADKPPWLEFGSVTRLSTIVLAKTFFEVSCHAGIPLLRVGNALQQIHIDHC